MKLTVAATAPAADLLVLPVYAGADGRGEPGPGVAEAGLLDAVAATRFAGREQDTVLVAGRDGDRFRAALLVGLGPPDDVDPNTLRRATDHAVRSARRFPTLATTLPQVGADPAAALAAVAEGALLGGYDPPGARPRADEPHRTEALTLLLPSPAAVDGVLDTAVVTAEAVNWTRALVDRPAADLTPPRLAEEAVTHGRSCGLAVHVHDVEALWSGGFGGLLAVGSGSTHPPCLIEARHTGRSGRTIGLVGKGITFDAGGLMVKGKTAMGDMRTDMAGAAVVLAVAGAAARLDCPHSVIALAPVAENMPSGTAYRPGDVIRHRGGRTSEVIDTDAEGRIVLADALAYLVEQAPDVMVDAATLTYDVIHALGEEITGIFGNHDGLVARLVAAGTAAGEPLWPLPLWAGYRRHLDSPVADVRNEGTAEADAIHAALFLNEFVAGVPWAHLDMAGTAYVEPGSDTRPAGATGTGVRTLLRWILDDPTLLEA